MYVNGLKAYHSKRVVKFLGIVHILMYTFILYMCLINGTELVSCVLWIFHTVEQMAQFHGCVWQNYANPLNFWSWCAQISCSERLAISALFCSRESYSAKIESSHMCAWPWNIWHGHLLISTGRFSFLHYSHPAGTFKVHLCRARHKADDDTSIFAVCWNALGAFIALGASFIRRLFPRRTALGRLVVVALTLYARQCDDYDIGREICGPADSGRQLRRIWNSLQSVQLLSVSEEPPRNAISSSISCPPDADGF